jgi:predicted GNAT family N-acyltransferase
MPDQDAIRFCRIETQADLECAQAIRRRVFVEEQNCPPEEEFDQYEASARHVLGLDRGRPVAAARWRVVERAGLPWAKLERIAVLADLRGQGIGREMVAWIMEDARAAGQHRFIMHAQSHLVPFYAAFGFVAIDEPFFEAGIPHRRMIAEDEAPV